MIASVVGMTTFIVSFARNMYSYWPLHVMLYPAGRTTAFATAACASRT